ncbi:hypothetical protein [Streptomyces sp. NPDC003877]
MFKPFEYADGATGGGPQGVPPVYVPQGAPPPEYDAYADPAAAHGWQDVYDDGTVAPGGDGHPGGEGRTGGEGLPGSADGPGAGERADDAGATRELPVVPDRARSGGGRGSRRKPPAWRTRRAAMAAGAVGAVSAAALIAGFSFSGTSSGEPGAREGGRTAPTAGETPDAPSSGGVRTSTPEGAPAGGAANGGEASVSTSAAPSSAADATPSAGGTDTPEPPADSPTAGTPTTQAPSTTEPRGRGDGKPGHGPGGTKGPK